MNTGFRTPGINVLGPLIKLCRIKRKIKGGCPEKIARATDKKFWVIEG
jgi:hypothetical protein